MLVKTVQVRRIAQIQQGLDPPDDKRAGLKAGIKAELAGAELEMRS